MYEGILDDYNDENKRLRTHADPRVSVLSSKIFFSFARKCQLRAT